MVCLDEFDENVRKHLLDLPCPTYSSTPFVTGVTLSNARLALVSTAGLHKKRDRPFAVGETGYRLIPRETPAGELVMSHISTNFDRTGFQLDHNTIFPLDRLNEMVEDGLLGSLAAYHYSFMGATDPTHMEREAVELAAILEKDGVNAVLLVPV